jgi:microcystin-dependent protein
MLKTDGSMLATAGFNAAGMAAAGTPALQASVSGDSQVRFVLAANGQMQWGPGGTTAVDTYLVRAGANVLQTSGTLIAGSGFNANGMTGVGSWAYQASVSGDTQPRFYIRADGVHAWGPGNAATDTSLQRWYAGAIYTPNVLGIGLNIRVYHGSVTTALTTEVGGDTQSRFLFDTNGHLQWGPGGSTAPDTNLYRSGAGILKTDGHLLVGQSIQMDRSGAGNAIYFGSANDTYLVRAGANVLQASGSLNVSQYVFAGANTGSGNWSFLARVSGDTNNRWDVMNQGLMHWGDGVNSPDTNLYRSAAGVLKTDGKIEAAGGFTVGGAAVGGVPSGSIIPYAGSAAPSGWVLADGTAYPRTGGTYDALFAAIGTTFGAGDGSTTFNVPDMRGRMPVSVGTHADVSTRGNNEGSAVASRRPKHPHSSALTFAGSGGATAIENAVHSHNVSDPGHNHNAYAGTTGGSNYTIQSFSNNDAGAVSSTTIAVAGTGISLSTETANHQHAFTPAGSIGGTIGAAGVANDAPAYLTLNFIVKL